MCFFGLEREVDVEEEGKAKKEGRRREEEGLSESRIGVKCIGLRCSVKFRILGGVDPKAVVSIITLYTQFRPVSVEVGGGELRPSVTPHSNAISHSQPLR